MMFITGGGRALVCAGVTRRYSTSPFIVDMRAAYPVLKHTATPAHAKVYSFWLAFLHSRYHGQCTGYRCHQFHPDSRAFYVLAGASC